jgi:mRNA interferase MazF
MIANCVNIINTYKPISNIRWGDVILVDFKTGVGSEQGGIRPALVISNNKGNTYSPMVIVCPITSQSKKYLPTHVDISPQESGLSKNSTVLMEQARAIDKSRIIKRYGHVDSDVVAESIEKALTISMARHYNRNIT